MNEKTFVTECPTEFIDYINEQVTSGWMLQKMWYKEKVSKHKVVVEYYALLSSPYLKFTIGPITER